MSWRSCMSVTIETRKKVWTEEELQSLPEDGFVHEVVDGELVMSPKSDFYHGDICSELLTAITTSRSLGLTPAAGDL